MNKKSILKVAQTYKFMVESTLTPQTPQLIIRPHPHQIQ